MKSSTEQSLLIEQIVRRKINLNLFSEGLSKLKCQEEVDSILFCLCENAKDITLLSHLLAHCSVPEQSISYALGFSVLKSNPVFVDHFIKMGVKINIDQADLLINALGHPPIFNSLMAAYDPADGFDENIDTVFVPLLETNQRRSIELLFSKGYKPDYDNPFIYEALTNISTYGRGSDAICFLLEENLLKDEIVKIIMKSKSENHPLFSDDKFIAAISQYELRFKVNQAPYAIAPAEILGF